MPKKSESLTIRLDADRKRKLRERCKTMDCGMTDYVLALMNSDLEIETPVVTGNAKIAEQQREIVLEKIRPHAPMSTSQRVDSCERIEDDGTRHKIKDGKVIACKKPGENWCYFL